MESANDADTDFPLQNLPYGVFRQAGQPFRCGVAIGKYVLDLALLEGLGLLDVARGRPVFADPSLNAFMSLGSFCWNSVRQQLLNLLAFGGDDRLQANAEAANRALVPLNDVELSLPFRVAEYTDFYSSRQHAFNVGSMFRDPENALPPNWLHMPIGYNGRASTVVVSPSAIRRPHGQIRDLGQPAPALRPSAHLDFELEMGAIVGSPSPIGSRLSVEQADDMIFGYVILNDWSARDVQTWEYQPLGPFQSKAFGTSISPWIVTKAALEPFRTSTPDREIALLDYLREPRPMSYDIAMDVALQPANATVETVISKTNYKHLYYSAAQQLAHHAVSGCAMTIGDLLGSGTISGPTEGSYGSLLELTRGGKKPLRLGNGESRTFLEDGDKVTMRARAGKKGNAIGFGACSGIVLPAR
ncbi:fumarylacetoacetase [Pelagibacterium lacus]|uniref:fumarylacetoacetase n=1 Tax=Pelagibacterium lacus TaxID=2282655 RepID=A0A369W2G5_9HYPH|nr:fumarylacetoacetase [Pelagibacterium lacus]